MLVGQPELADRLNEQSLRQLKQRITLRAQLAPLDLKETAAYVAGRLRIAGGNVSEILTKNAVLAIHEISNGLPRIVNVLADNALMGGFAAHTDPVDAAIVREVGRDFDFGVGGVAVQPPFSGPARRRPRRTGRRPSALAPISEETANIGVIDRGLGDGRAPSADSTVTARKKRFLFF